MSSKAVAAFEDKKQDIVVKEFGGVNLSAHRTQIGKEEFSWLENLVPLGYANMPVVPGPGTLAANTLFAVPSAAFMFYANLVLPSSLSIAIDFLFVVKTDGSLSSVNLSSGAIVNNIFSAGTFDTATVAMAQWKNERIVIVDKTNYRSYDGSQTFSTGSLVQVTITSGGAGYTSRPTVSFTGGSGLGGAGAALMQLNGAQAVAAGGTGYSVGDVLTFSTGNGNPEAQVRVDTLGAGNSVATVSIYRTGSYAILGAPPIATTGGTGTGATITPLWNVLSVSVTNAALSTPYISAPTVVFTGGGFSSTATATSSILLGAVPSLSGATPPAQAIATFSGRVWVANGRLVSYSAPDSWFDFSAATAGGSFLMEDETLEASVNQIISANGFLYIAGNTSVDTLSDVRVVAGSPPITTFSKVNISAQIGSQFRQTNPIIPFGKSLIWSARFGMYSLLGSTTKKFSDKLDLLMKAVTVSGGQFLGAGVCKLYGALCPTFLVSYPDGSALGTRTLIIGLMNGRWFFVTQGTPTLLAGATVAGDHRIYASDGTNIYQVFGETTNTSTISWKITTALWPASTPISDKQLLKCGVEVSPLDSSLVMVPGPNTDVPVVINVSLENERGIFVSPVVLASSTAQWMNAAGTVGSWINAGGVVGDWLLPGFNILQSDASTKGRYVGYTLTGQTRGFTINGILGQYEERAKWNASGVS